MKNQPPTPAQRAARAENWRRFQLTSVIFVLRRYGFPKEADAVQFSLDEERRIAERHKKEKK